MDYYRKDRNVQSLMIELNRKLYMDEKTGMKNESCDSVKTKIQKVLKGIMKSFK
jgi:N-formylglutamate deformylase